MTPQRVHDWFGEQAAAGPERPAIEVRGRRVTYGELEARACGLASALASRGAGPGSRIAILADDVPDMIASILAALKSGGVFVPLDPRIPDSQLAAMVSEAAIDWFIAEPSFSSLIERVAGRAERRHVLRLDEASIAASSEFASVDRSPDDCCYIYFTSGSTGRPKGIAGRLKAIDHFIAWELRRFGLAEGVRVSQLTTPSFDASLRDFFVPLCAGGTICVPESADVKLDAARLIQWIDEARVEVVHCVPSVFRAMLNEGLDAAAFQSLKYVLLAGEALLPYDVRRWMDVYGDRITLVNLYGPSETTMVKFFHVVTRGDADRASIPIGVPMDGCTAILVDEQNRPCPRGAVGEIWIRTPYRSLGYFGRDDLTTQVFIPNPFGSDPKDLIYRTGDLGRMLASGAYELVGRKDHQVKIRGERVELAAIEAALLRHDDVVDAVVVDRDDGAGFKYLCAYIVLRAGAATPDLRAFLAKDYAPVMVPSSIVVTDRLPRLVNGKVDRRALPADAASQPPAVAYEAPRTPIEERLSGLFGEVLRRERVGIRENFFELGGHSLLATQLVSRVRKAFNVELPVRSLFDAPTVAALAEHVEVLEWAATPAAASRRPPVAGVAELEL